MIKITDEIFIDADERQYILVEKIKNPSPKSKKTHNALGYYGSAASALEDCARRFMRRKVQTTDMSISEAVAAFKRIEAELKELLPKEM